MALMIWQRGGCLREFAGRHKALFFSAQRRMILWIFWTFPRWCKHFSKALLYLLFKIGKLNLNILQEKFQTKNWYWLLMSFLFWQNRILQWHLEAFSSEISLEENIKNNLLTEGTFLNDEPQTLLRIELREPSVYNSILEAISNGCNKVCEIADRIHEEKSKCSKYILTLQTLRLIEKCVPCTEPETSKKGIYEITDNYYKFWYRFLFTNQNYYSMLCLELSCEETSVYSI